MTTYLRNITPYRVIKEVSAPIMFLGLPLKLSYIYLGSILGGVMVALILSIMNVGLLATILVAVIIVSGGVGGVTVFYKKYGLTGFYLKKRNSEFPQTISADKSILTILKTKK